MLNCDRMVASSSWLLVFPLDKAAPVVKLRVRSAVPPWPVSVMLALACSPMAVRVALSASLLVVGAYSTVTWHDFLGPRLRPPQRSLVIENAVPLVFVSATAASVPVAVDGPKVVSATARGRRPGEHRPAPKSRPPAFPSQPLRQ